MLTIAPLISMFGALGWGELLIAFLISFSLALHTAHYAQAQGYSRFMCGGVPGDLGISVADSAARGPLLARRFARQGLAAELP